MPPSGGLSVRPAFDGVPGLFGGAVLSAAVGHDGGPQCGQGTPLHVVLAIASEARICGQRNR